jgi:hypothetical protein
MEHGNIHMQPTVCLVAVPIIVRLVSITVAAGFFLSVQALLDRCRLLTYALLLTISVTVLVPMTRKADSNPTCLATLPGVSFAPKHTALAVSSNNFTKLTTLHVVGDRLVSVPIGYTKLALGCHLMHKVEAESGGVHRTSNICFDLVCVHCGSLQIYHSKVCLGLTDCDGLVVLLHAMPHVSSTPAV